MKKDNKFYKKTVKITLGIPGDWQTEYYTEKDWERWEKAVQSLKDRGEYLKEVDIDFIVEPDNLYDNKDSKDIGTAVESYRFDILDFSKNEER